MASRFMILSVISIWGLVSCKSEFLPIGNAYTVSINHGDTLVTFQVQGIEEEPKINDEVQYTWFKSNKIYQSQGGYSGQLLHGKYEEFLDKKMVKKGYYDNGRKIGEWRSWNLNGDLRNMVTYKNGLLNGDYKIFEPAGELKEYGSLKDGQRHGKIITLFPNDSTLAVKYQNGVPRDTVSAKFLGVF